MTPVLAGICIEVGQSLHNEVCGFLRLPASSTHPLAPCAGTGTFVGKLLMKTYLNVPIAQKDRAKNLGALWDPARKRWYVPDGVDLTPFLGWVPRLPRLDKRIKRVLKQPVR